MKSWNRRFFLPSILVCCVLISTAVLAQNEQNSSSVEEKEVVETVAVLPVAADRVIGTQPLVSKLEVTVKNEVASSTSEVIEPSQMAVPQVTNPQTQANTTPEVTHSVQAEEAEQIQVKLIIQGPGVSKSGKISVKSGATVYQVMKQGSQELDFSLKTSHHSSLGIFVEGIAGVINNPKTNLYWLYYLNGQFASRGVSLQTVQEGDIITWSYE